MDIQGLKDKILQLAIQGKLVEQDKNDEPASVLLEKIKEERDRLVKEKKIRKRKNLETIEDDEKPFDILDSWEWVRLGDITRICLGLTHRPEYVEEGIPFLSVKDISSGSISFSNCRFIEIEKYNSLPEGSKPQKGDVLFGRVGTLGVPSIVDVDFPFGIFVSLGFLRPYIINMNIYLKMFMESKLFFDQIYANVFGSAQINLNTGWLSSFIVPIPPLEEQKRIVEKVDQLFALIDELDSSKKDFLEVINLTRNQVLQEAIQGRLVAQNPEDEPASVLLEKIKEERDILVKEKKIRKQKPLPEITEEEKAFDIPENWEWVRFQEVLDVRDGTHDTPKYIDTGIPLITSKNLINGEINFDNIKCISIEDHKKISERSNVENEDILFAMIGSIGNPVIVNGNIEFSIKNVALFKYYKKGLIIPKYLYYYLFFSQKEMKKQSSGGVQSFVSLTFLRNYIFPFPPLAEQKRIVEKIDQLFALIDGLEKQLNNSN